MSTKRFTQHCVLFSCTDIRQQRYDNVERHKCSSLVDCRVFAQIWPRCTHCRRRSSIWEKVKRVHWTLWASKVSPSSYLLSYYCLSISQTYLHYIMVYNYYILVSCIRPTFPLQCHTNESTLLTEYRSQQARDAGMDKVILLYS